MRLDGFLGGGGGMTSTSGSDSDDDSDSNGGGGGGGGGGLFSGITNAANDALDVFNGGGGGSSSNNDDEDEQNRDENQNSQKKEKKQSGGGVIASAVSAATDAADDAADAATDAANDAVDTATDAADDAADAATDAADDAADAATDAANDAGKKAWEAAGDATGYNAMKEAGTVGRLQREMQNSDNVAGKLNAGFKFTQNFVLDNPNASVQDAVKAAAKAPTEAATGEEVTDKELAEATQNTAEAAANAVATPGKEFAKATDGTAVDNAAVQSVGKAGEFAYNALIKDPANSATKLATGIDPSTGKTNADTSALEAFDVGATVATLGTGKAASTALSQGAKATSKMGKFGTLIGLSDEVVSGISRSGDELVSTFKFGGTGTGALDNAATSVDEGGALADDATQQLSNVGLDTFKTGDGAFSSLTDDSAALSLSDDTASAVDDALSTSDDVAASTDDAAQLSDEGGSVFDDALSTADEGATVTDDAAAASDEGASLTDRISSTASKFLDTTTGKAVTAGAAVGAGGTAFTALSGTLNQPVRTADGTLLSPVKDYQPTDRFPNGGTLVKISRNGSKQGYTVVLGRKGANLIVLDSKGQPTKARISAEQFRQLMKNGGAA